MWKYLANAQNRCLRDFMPALIFHQLGGTLTSTLETPFSKLREWNTDTKNRRGLSRPSDDVDELLALAERLGELRVDMVLFEGEGVPKHEQAMCALVEFKRGFLDYESKDYRRSDKEKLTEILKHIDTCPYGIVCGSACQKIRDWHENKAFEARDRWYAKQVENRAQDFGSYFFCARVFERPAQ